jgi:hypothetical protein
MEFILNICLIDAAGFVFLLGSFIITLRVSTRSGTSIFRIIAGFERMALFELTTVKEKIVFLS